MAKSINIPDSISKTQIVEELFRNMKDNPVHNQEANALRAYKSISKDFHDVVNVSQAKAYEKINEEDESPHHNSNDEELEDEDNEEIEEENKSTDSSESEQEDEDNPEKPFDKKGLLLDIEG